MEEQRSIWERLHDHFVPTEHNRYRPHSLSRDFLVTLVAVVCVVEGFLLTTLFMQSSPGQFAAAVIKSAIVNLTNAERAQAGDGELAVNATLERAAQAKAEDMAARGYFSHVGPDGRQPWGWITDAGYDYAYAGENLAVQFYDSADVVRAWMNSPAHRANIVKGAYKEIGIGIAEGYYEGRPTVFVVQFFGTSRAALGLGVHRGAAVAAKPDMAIEDNAATGTLREASALVAPDVVVEASGVETLGDAEQASVPEVETVAGQSTSQIPASITRLFNSPRSLATWVLGAILTTLITAMTLAVVIRMHIQATDMVLSGAVVAALIFSFIALNSYVLTGATIPESSPAAAVEAVR